MSPEEKAEHEAIMEFLRGGWEVVGQNVLRRKPRLNTPVRIATDAGYMGA